MTGVRRNGNGNGTAAEKAWGLTAPPPAAAAPIHHHTTLNEKDLTRSQIAAAVAREQSAPPAKHYDADGELELFHPLMHLTRSCLLAACLFACDNPNPITDSASALSQLLRKLLYMRELGFLLPT